MINRYVQQLKSSDPARRREAIIALGKSGDQAALSPLADVYRGDPDPALRDLALRAGRHLRSQLQAAPAAPAAGHDRRLSEELSRYEAEAEERPPRPAAAPRKRAVTPDDIRRAKEYVEEALSHNIKGDNAKGLKALRRALDANPGLQDDGYFLSVAGAVTGHNGPQAVAYILDREHARDFVRQSVREQRAVRTARHMEKAKQSSWAGVWLEVGVYFLINTIAIAVIFIVLIETLRAALQDPAALGDPTVATELAAFNATVAAIGVGSGLLIGLISGLYNTINALIQAVAIHIFATLIFQGKSTLRFFMDKLFSLYNRRMPIIYVIFGVGLFLTFVSPIIGGLITLVGTLFALSLTMKIISVTGEAYNFGFLGGCLSNLLAVGALILIGVLLQVAVGSALFSALLPNLPSGF